jgi:TPR repeat protein
MEKDAHVALQFYLKAAKENFPRALNNLGSFYLQNPTYKNM